MARKSEKATSASKKSSPAAAKEEAKAPVQAQAQPEVVVSEESPPVKADGLLQVTLTSALFDKLKEQAEEEGISLQEYTRELLAEAATLRAFEIVERRFQMRGGNPQAIGINRGNHPNQNNSNSNNNNNRQQHGGGGRRNDRNNSNNRRGMSHARYQNIMDDKATFLEYVRNQERQQR